MDVEPGIKITFEECVEHILGRGTFAASTDQRCSYTPYYTTDMDTFDLSLNLCMA